MTALFPLTPAVSLGERMKLYRDLKGFVLSDRIQRKTVRCRYEESPQLIQRVAVFEGELQQSVRADEFEFLANVRAMGLDRARADE